jgi:hypothetical protein
MPFPAPPRLHVLHVPGADMERDAIVYRLETESDACLHLDPDRAGVMPTWLAALSCAVERDGADDYDWSLIVQDDAYPLRGWQQHVERACTSSPEPVLGLTHFGAYGARPLADGCAYGVGPYLIWGGAVAYHRSFVTRLWAWADRVYSETGYPHDDVLACAFAMKIGRRTAMAARAIFDQPVQRSLLGHNTPIRRPATTIETAGPAYNVKERSKNVSRSISPKGELERLAAL